MKRTNIGGQGVLEGVMMRSEKYTAIAVRQEPGNIVTQKQKSHMLREKYRALGWPIIRGVVNFVEMLVLGVKTITDAAKMYDPTLTEEDETNKAERFIAEKTGKNPMDVAIFFAVLIAIVVAVALFFILPNLITGWITPYIENAFLKNLVEGGVRITMFLLYLGAVSSMKEIKRLFGYHGAEHKVINCYEYEKPLTVESARECSRFHPRCGTSFLLIVMTISILLFAILGWSDSWLVRIATRLAMLPVVAGVSYEVLRFLGRHDGPVIDFLRKPGMALQRITTREPDDGMLETALVAFLLAEDELADEQVQEMAEGFSREVTGEANAPEDGVADTGTAEEHQLTQ